MTTNLTDTPAATPQSPPALLRAAHLVLPTGVVVLGMVALFSMAMAIFPSKSGAPPEELVSHLQDLQPSTVYALTSADFGHLDARVASILPGAAIASYAGEAAPAGPIVTRSRGWERWIPHGATQAWATSRTFGDWTIVMPEVVHHSAAPRLAVARVELHDPEGKVAPCAPFERGRFQCLSDGWAHVGERTVRVRDRDEQCIWAHPIQDQTIVITYPGVKASAPDRSWALETALSDQAVGSGGAVDVEIRHGSASVRHRHPDRRGWTRAIIPSSDSEDLELRISAVKTGRRHFCYRLLEDE